MIDERRKLWEGNVRGVVFRIVETVGVNNWEIEKLGTDLLGGACWQLVEPDSAIAEAVKLDAMRSLVAALVKANLRIGEMGREYQAITGAPCP